MSSALSIASLLAGPVARALGENFEPRPEQAQMAEAVAKAFEARSHLLVEAGTGVGKSFAYLVPAMLRCMMRGETVVISTHTIQLQEQIVTKDVPLLQSVLADVRAHVRAQTGMDPFLDEMGEERTLRPVLVKGRGNYVSIRRLKLASQRQDRLFSDPAAKRSLHVIEDWAMETMDGTTSTLPQLERMGVWDKVQSDSGNCMGIKCPHHKECFYQSARREMQDANLLICNHAVFFSDLSLRSQDVGFLPPYHHVVLDEAHTVEDVASEHFGESLSEGRVNHLLGTLYQPRTGKGYLGQLSVSSEDGRSVDRAIALTQQAQSAARGFFESLIRVGAPIETENPFSAYSRSKDEPRTVRVREAGRVENALAPVMRELALRLKSLKEEAKLDADRYELNSYADRCAMVADAADVLVGQTLPGCAYWIEVSGGEDNDVSPTGNARSSQKVEIACSPVEVGPLLKERLFSKGVSVVLTSATLATRTVEQGEATERAETAFAHTMLRLGCEGAAALQLGSPFDYAKQAAVIIEQPNQPPRSSTLGRLEATEGPRGESRRRVVPVEDDSANSDLPEWARGIDTPPTNLYRPKPADRAFSSPKSQATAFLCERILHHVKETQGGAFVLFTSFATLHAVARELTGPCAALGYPLLAQGRDGSRAAILQRFRESDRSVLLGAASFWQGVDVRGRALRNVIITKLPFDPPDRPLTQARNELIESRGGNPFMEDSLPRALMKFKQGFGRLIRSKTDTGRVVILDERVVTARYGRLFLAALPVGVPVVRG